MDARTPFTPSRCRNVAWDGTPRKQAAASAKKPKQQVGCLCRGRWAIHLALCPLARCGSCVQMDRFIPARSAMDLDVAHYNLLKENCGSGAVSSPCKARPAHAFHALCCLRSPGAEVTTISV